MTATYWLRFSDRAAAIAAFEAHGMAVGDLPSPGYLDGTRFDALPVGGDGIWREQDGVETIDVAGSAIEVPRMVARDGYHIDLVWQGDPETAPDLSAFVATEAGAWAYAGDPASAAFDPTPTLDDQVAALTEAYERKRANLVTRLDNVQLADGPDEATKTSALQAKFAQISNEYSTALEALFEV